MFPFVRRSDSTEFIIAAGMVADSMNWETGGLLRSVK